MFQGCQPTFVRELAQKAKLLLIPKNTTMLLFGTQMFDTVEFQLASESKYNYA